MSREPMARDAYEALAEAYAARIDVKPHNALYERPAMQALLPSVTGKRVLDAGCGPGVYAEWLADHRAEVIGIDVSPRMVELAQRRLRGRARFQHADLGQPLEFLASASFDLILSALALDYVHDWAAAFREFHRLLRKGGHVVFSAGHPFDEFFEHHPTGNYFAVERVEWMFRGFGAPTRVPYFRRPLSAVLDPLFEAGFILERLVEPRSTPEFRDHERGDSAKRLRIPGFVCIRAKKSD